MYYCIQCDTLTDFSELSPDDRDGPVNGGSAVRAARSMTAQRRRFSGHLTRDSPISPKNRPTSRGTRLVGEWPHSGVHQ